MTWAELQIPEAPPTGNTEFDRWLNLVTKHLRTYLGAYHDRGDPAAVDFDVSDTTEDNTWRELDLSGIVDAGAKAVVLRVYLIDATAASKLKLRKNGNSNETAIHVLNTQVGGIGINSCPIVALSDDGKIDYLVSEAVTALSITVIGWWK